MILRLLIFAGLIYAFYVLAKRALAPGGTMNIADAARLLDVAPDAGGTSPLATQVNQARDILLRNISRR